MTDGQTDIPTDRQTQGEKQYVSRPLQGGGGHNYCHLFLNIAFKAYFITFWLFKMLVNRLEILGKSETVVAIFRLEIAWA